MNEEINRLRAHLMTIKVVIALKERLTDSDLVIADIVEQALGDTTDDVETETVDPTRELHRLQEYKP